VHQSRRVSFGEALAGLQHDVYRFRLGQHAPLRQVLIETDALQSGSITRYGSPDSSTPTSKTRAMCSPFSCAVARASLTERCLHRLAIVLQVGVDDLDGDGRAQKQVCPRATTPIPPPPSTSPTR